MRISSLFAGSVLLGSIALAAACSSSDGASSSSGGTDGGGADSSPPGADGGPGPGSDGGADAGADADEPLTKQTETEPNNGSTKTETNAMTLPGEMTGKIDPANDVDIFSVQIAPGDLWEWTVTPSSADLAPHVTVFDTAPNNLNPTVLAQAAAGSPATIQHFVLRTGSFVAAVRDARNVPTGTGKGGPTFGYTFTGKRRTPSPVAVTFPTTKSGKLASLSSIDLYSFNGTKDMGFDIVIKAARKASPSTMDSRLSLFDMGSKTALITNDDAAGTTDSQIGGTLPATSTYVVIVENEGTNATDLSYDIAFTLR
jgi:hypothetical protein